MAALLPLRVHVGTLVLLSSSATVLATPIQDCEAWARSMYFSVLCQVGYVRRLARAAAPLRPPLHAADHHYYYYDILTSRSQCSVTH